MIDYQPLIERWQDGELAPWAEQLPAQIDAGLSQQRYGDLARWLEALAALPDLQVDHVELTDAESVQQRPATRCRATGTAGDRLARSAPVAQGSL